MSTQDKTKPLLPLRYLVDEGQFIVDAHSNIVAEIPCQGVDPVMGHVFVAAVNSHQQLVDALKAAKGILGNLDSPTAEEFKRVMKQINSALDAAKEKE